MPRVFYSPEQRNTILSTVAEARKSGQKWAEVHPLAQTSGFRGGLQALMIFVKKSSKTAKGKRGRPAGAVAKTAVKPAPSTHNYNDLQSAIDQMVQARVSEALEKAIASLRGALPQ